MTQSDRLRKWAPIIGMLCGPDAANAIRDKAREIEQRAHPVARPESLEDCLFYGAVDAARRVSDRRVVVHLGNGRMM